MTAHRRPVDAGAGSGGFAPRRVREALGEDPALVRDPAEQLRHASLRVTMQRTAVLRVLEHNPHSDVGFIARAVRGTVGAISIQAVYNTLAALGDAGLVRKIEPAGSPALYEPRADDNHHYAVCRACGAVADVDCAAEERPCLSPSDTHGFVVDEAEVIYWGLCPSCTGRAHAN